MIKLENGWYQIEILGGESLQNGEYEPTYEFVLQEITAKDVVANADLNFNFEITSLAY